jgi:hypothetical protein
VKQHQDCSDTIKNAYQNAHSEEIAGVMQPPQFPHRAFDWIWHPSSSDADWNTFSGLCGSIYVTGRVNSASQSIAAVSYTGTTRIGGTGGTQTTLASTTGWYTLVANAAATTMIQINDATSPYTGDNITVTANIAANAASLTLTTTWNSSSRVAAGETTNISGGTNTASPFTTFGTAPAVLCRYIPPSSTYLTTASWGTPTVTSTVT